VGRCIVNNAIAYSTANTVSNSIFLHGKINIRIGRGLLRKENHYENGKKSKPYFGVDADIPSLF